MIISSFTDDISRLAHVLCRPHEHGEDMLAPMSAILNEYSEQHHSSAVCIVLRGLYALCESEVKCTETIIIISNFQIQLQTLVIRLFFTEIINENGVDHNFRFVFFLN